MTPVSTNIKIDPDLKKESQILFEQLGLNLSTAINMFLRQAVQCDGLPFDVKRHKPNAETVAAIEEGEEILKHPDKYPSYNSASELFAAVLGDVE